MKTTKKLVTLFLGICLVASLSVGCGSGAKNSEATTSNEKDKVSESSTAATSSTSATSAPAAGGSLAGSVEALSDAVDLTSVGTTDWAHWYGYDQKSTGGSKISDYTVLGTGAVKNYEDDPRQITWSDGTPTASGSSTSGVYVEGRGSGFSIDVPADSTEHTVKVYVGGWKSSGMLIAHLSDGSAPDYTATTEQAGDSFDLVCTLVFKAASDGQTLTVKWLQSSSEKGNVTLQAAALE